TVFRSSHRPRGRWLRPVICAAGPRRTRSGGGGRCRGSRGVFVIRSMTGFASVSHELAGDTVNITVKSVNHRFLDVALKVPQALAPLDARVRAIVNQRLT